MTSTDTSGGRIAFQGELGAVEVAMLEKEAAQVIEVGDALALWVCSQRRRVAGYLLEDLRGIASFATLEEDL